MASGASAATSCHLREIGTSNTFFFFEGSSIALRSVTVPMSYLSSSVTLAVNDLTVMSKLFGLYPSSLASTLIPDGLMLVIRPEIGVIVGGSGFEQAPRARAATNR